MNKIQKKLAITLSILISAQFFCFTPPVSAHATEKVVDCCESQQVECRLEELGHGSFLDNKANTLKEVLLEADIEFFNSTYLNFQYNPGFSEANPSFNRILKEIATIRLLL